MEGLHSGEYPVAALQALAHGLAHLYLLEAAVEGVSVGVDELLHLLLGKDGDFQPGAMLRFKRETMRDVSEIENDLEDSVRLAHCCVVSACKADGVPFDMDLLTFADYLSAEDLNAFAASLSAPEGKKK